MVHAQLLLTPPIGKYKASLRKTLFAPTLSDFLETLNDLPFVQGRQDARRLVG
jgi:hypothetical protein